MCCWIQFASILRNFASILIRDIDLYFSDSVFFWLCYQGNADLIKWVWKYFFLFYFFWKGFKVTVNSLQTFFKCLVTFISEAIWSWALLHWEIFKFFYYFIDLISLLVIDLFRLSIPSWFTLDCFYVSKNFSTSRLLNYWHTAIHNSLLWTLYFYCISCNSPLTFTVLLI